ncbi:hypothetical protein Lal_00023401 [Lupinus albus]|uniref:Uncharacterized protein n=1 Tax=Lupinus albus TaxID=3870 RepID=A0A6A5NI29_LUPAL|nr:hypothetical protein Lalb_Chr20g0107921 [Lupinus albus]KAF1881365.1 hypothetical protein Lal_00023401 [Lupinus albus]
MEALSLSYYYFHLKNVLGHELKNRYNPRFVILLSSKDRKNKDKGGKLRVLKMFSGFEKLGKRLKQNLSPQQKGDWKDLFLMSLSFAVYVYISQKLVSAYFAWSSMPKHLW